MPRRFGIATIMILTAVFAVLFGVLRMLDATPAVFVGITIFVAGVAACQALLFGGKNPRAASIIGGAVIFYLIMVVVCLTNEFGPRDFTKQITFSFQGGMMLFMIGGLLGYLAGGLLAAVFLVRKEPVNSPPETPATYDDDPTKTWDTEDDTASE